ncbi:MAG: alkaline phosphatase family protein [Actinomycetota bacterium]
METRHIGSRTIRLKGIAGFLVFALITGACSLGSDDDAQDARAEEVSPPQLRGGIEKFPEEKRVTTPPDGWFNSGCDLPFEYLQRVRRGTYGDTRGPDLLVVPQIPHFFGAFSTTSHSGPWPYVQRVPLVFYGPGFIREQGKLEVDRDVTLADLAPTLAELLGVDFPRSHVGRSIDGVLLPEEERDGTPKMVLQIVWDGGGWNVLETWPDAWPHYKELMEGGTSVQNVTVGSSPSVTPAIHATMGTGTFPKQHGIVNIPMRGESGEVGQSFPLGNPKNLEVPTIADLYDPSVGNAALVGMMAYRFFHLGMMGHGAYLEGGDNDYAILATTLPGQLRTNTDYFQMPSYLQEVGGFQRDIRWTDAEDGEVDNEWRGEPLDIKQTRRHSPVWVRYQTRLLKKLFREEGFGQDEVTDLFFTNFKQIDDVGHVWNMLDPAMESVIKASDDSVKDLTSFLDENVGRGEWVLVMTADHGQAPDPQAVGSWPIQMSELTKDVAEHFGMTYDEMFQDQQATGFYLRTDTLAANGVTMEEIADFVINYRLRDNIKSDQTPPDQYRDRGDETLFAAAFPATKLPTIWGCALDKQAAG